MKNKDSGMTSLQKERAVTRRALKDSDKELHNLTQKVENLSENLKRSKTEINSLKAETKKIMKQTKLNKQVTKCSNTNSLLPSTPSSSNSSIAAPVASPTETNNNLTSTPVKTDNSIPRITPLLGTQSPRTPPSNSTSTVPILELNPISFPVNPTITTLANLKCQNKRNS